MKKNASVSDSYGYNLRAAHRAFDRQLQSAIGKHNIKNGHWYFLRVLWENEGLTQRELSDEVNLMESSTVIMLEQMERTGLIRKRRDPEDRRKLNIFLTPKARKLKDKLLPYATKINDLAATGISKRDLQTFNRVAQQMKKNLLASGNIE